MKPKDLREAKHKSLILTERGRPKKYIMIEPLAEGVRMYSLEKKQYVVVSRKEYLDMIENNTDN
jgi:hypothetical protein